MQAHRVGGVDLVVHNDDSSAKPIRKTDKQVWVIKFNQSICTDSDVESVEATLPLELRVAYVGKPSRGNVCLLAIEGTEDQVHTFLKKGSLGKEGQGSPDGVAKLQIENDIPASRDLDKHGDPLSPLPVNGEGWPSISLSPDIMFNHSGKGRNIGHKLEVSLSLCACKGTCAVDVFYPLFKPPDQKPFPLIAFAHGYTQGGPKGSDAYRERLFEPVVSQGYCIVSHLSADAFFDPACQSLEQRGMLDPSWYDGPGENARFSSMFETLRAIPELQEKCDFHNVALMGYSMGGFATLVSASDLNFTKTHNVTAAVALAPYSDCATYHHTRVPTMISWFSSDNVLSADQGSCALRLTSKKIWNQHDGNHMSVGSFGQNPYVPCALAHLNCHTKGQLHACTQLVTTCDTGPINPIGPTEARDGPFSPNATFYLEYQGGLCPNMEMLHVGYARNEDECYAKVRSASECGSRFIFQAPLCQCTQKSPDPCMFLPVIDGMKVFHVQSAAFSPRFKPVLLLLGLAAWLISKPVSMEA